jgi:hypothetical protein
VSGLALGPAGVLSELAWCLEPSNFLRESKINVIPLPFVGLNLHLAGDGIGEPGQRELDCGIRDTV